MLNQDQPTDDGSTIDIESCDKDHVPHRRSVGPDNSGSLNSVSSIDTPPMRVWKIKMPGNQIDLVFNPVTTFASSLVIWGLAGWCMATPETALDSLSDVQGKVTRYFGWLYIVSQPLWFIFLFFVYCKFGDQKLGRVGAQKEFTDMEYFCLLFSAGVAVGLFFYGVSEPLFHMSHFEHIADVENTIDIMSLNQTVFHWVIPWGVYVIVSLVCGIAVRDGQPLTLRSCFNQLLGHHTSGYLGDLIDAYGIIVVISGVCTSLGLGAIQIVQGAETVFDTEFSESALTNARMICIAVVTLMATVSVVSGLNAGIKTLSQVALCLGITLWFLVLTFDMTAYILNLVIQETGYLISTIIPMSFHAEAFNQLVPGAGGLNNPDPGWLNGWTVFYLGWWVSWSSFVGMFIARVSEGRTIREVFHFTVLGPVVYVILWFGVFSGAGIRMTRRAQELIDIGVVEYNNSDYFLQPGSSHCYVPPPNNLVLSNGTIYYTEPHISPVCTFDSGNSDSAWFEVLSQYYSFGPFLCVLSLIAIAIYFVTSSDSGSLIVDMLASNGCSKHHVLQRIFWALTEGALAISLLFASGKSGLQALQAASIIAGLPFAVLVLFMMLNLWRSLSAYKKRGQDTFMPKNFELEVYGGVFNSFETLFSLSKNHQRSAYIKHPEMETVALFFKSLFLPFTTYHFVRTALNGKTRHTKQNKVLTGVLTFMYFAWIGLFISCVAEPGMYGFAWVAYFVFAFMIANERRSCRRRFNIIGNPFIDVFTSFVLWPQVLSQIANEIKTRGDCRDSASDVSGLESDDEDDQ